MFAPPVKYRNKDVNKDYCFQNTTLSLSYQFLHWSPESSLEVSDVRTSGGLLGDVPGKVPFFNIFKKCTLSRISPGNFLFKSLWWSTFSLKLESKKLQHSKERLIWAIFERLHFHETTLVKKWDQPLAQKN